MDHREKARQKREEINDALNINGFDILFDADIFLMDMWSKEDGLNYLVGINEIIESETYDPYKTSVALFTLDGDFYDETQEEKKSIFYAFLRKLNRIEKIWNSGMHNPHNKPSYYINWAISKGFEIPWLDYAIEKGFYIPIKNNKVEIEEKINSKKHKTSLIKIQELAISEFYEPRKNIDPKKEEVKNWIKDKAKELNIFVSDNIADAIFTIIKPDDHNPKVKRAEPID